MTMAPSLYRALDGTPLPSRSVPSLTVSFSDISLCCTFGTGPGTDVLKVKNSGDANASFTIPVTSSPVCCLANYGSSFPLILLVNNLDGCLAGGGSDLVGIGTIFITYSPVTKWIHSIEFTFSAPDGSHEASIFTWVNPVAADGSCGTLGSYSNTNDPCDPSSYLSSGGTGGEATVTE